MNTVCSKVWKDFKQTEGSSADPVLRQRSCNVHNKHRCWSVLVISDPALSGPDVILHMKTDSDSNIRSALRIIVYLKPRYQPGSGNIWIGVCQIMIVAQTPIITNTCAGAGFMVQVLQGYLGRSARWSLSRERTLLHLYLRCADTCNLCCTDKEAEESPDWRWGGATIPLLLRVCVNHESHHREELTDSLWGTKGGEAQQLQNNRKTSKSSQK